MMVLQSTLFLLQSTLSLVQKAHDGATEHFFTDHLLNNVCFLFVRQGPRVFL